MLETRGWSAVKTWRIKVDENIEKTREFSQKKKGKLINCDSSNSLPVELFPANGVPFVYYTLLTSETWKSSVKCD